MNNVYGFKTISDALLCGCGSVGPGAAASLGLAFILWNYATSARVSLKGPLAALAGLAGGRFLFFSNLISGHLGLTILNSYLILAGGLALIWLASKRARYVQAAAAWSGGPVPSRLFWPYGFLFGWALASLSRPGLDIFGLNLIIFGFKGQGWPLWIFLDFRQYGYFEPGSNHHSGGPFRA